MAHYFTNINNSYPSFRKGGSTAFFCHSSYEPRALACIKSSGNCQGIDSTFIFHSDDYLESETYQQNHSELVRYFSSVSNVDPIQIAVRSSNNDDSLDAYKDLIAQSISQADDIAVDITTFTRGRMICLLDFLLRKKGEKPLYLFYSEPERYGTENNGKMSTWLTKGVKHIVSVPGFCGEKQEEKKSLLILLLGHDSERAISTIEAFNPDKIVMVSQGTLKCRKGLQEVFLKSNAKVQDRHADKIVNILTVPPRGWEAVYDVFSRIHALYKNQFNITACLNGTKIQVLGALTFCQKHPSIELLYLEPEKYNRDAYTHGIGQTWWLEVPNMDLFKKW